MILTKAGFGFKVSNFFSDYLINRQTQYIWDLFTFPFLEQLLVLGKGQPFHLFFQPFILHLSFIFWKKRSKNLSIPISILSFVDDGLLISQEKLLKNQMWIFFVAIVLFLLFLDNLGSSLNMTSPKFFISPEPQRILILLL